MSKYNIKQNISTVYGVVQEYRLKYSRSGSGRLVKRKIGEIAERDPYKQVNYKLILFVSSFFLDDNNSAK